ncbi:uroporphyrinogen-III synthase [Asticcacaulis sp. ZE23SCel15]|uniref:uroporphyrinogen-III synthase n=1 Tax=Asticcacaulis sp. ZE23SCel15 TaxID=3059027 RepID=UPI0026604345|nr:uroporphyrinogen-III synthase [Asticcacaulis sp. ZE23SCel15]WKL57816.1 uroporphyrinogen-III synthase [Asticcacaulis sp. ZE23SCel15]
MKVWVTRTANRAHKTAAAVEALGFETLIDPVLKVERLPAQSLKGGFGAIAFTSRSAVEIFAKTYPLRTVSTFCVGDATAEAAHEHGFARVLSAAGDGRALFDLIRQHRPQAVIVCAPETPAAPLAEWLTADGIRAHELALYRTVTICPDTALNAIEDIDIILLHSPRAARFIGEMLRTKMSPETVKRLSFIAISKACAEALIAGLNEPETASGEAERENVSEISPKVLISQFPDEASMLMLLSNIPR